MEHILHVKTLGGFSLRCSHPDQPDVEITEQDSGSWRQWTFLQYLCVFHQRRIPQEEIIDILWGDVEINNPVNTLKTLLHRARLTLERLGFPDGKKVLLYRRGVYTWDPELTIRLDTEEFDSLRALFEADPAARTA